ncbi:MAG TPA: nucleoid occlusion protein [Bacillota bacterium]|nr:nucleoid occlusion protein [Bacillota bacterium]
MLHPFNRLFGIGNKADTEEEPMEEQSDEVVNVRVDQMEPNQFQPRSIFNEEKIKELAQTIHTHGMIQPIVVREKDGDEEIYEIIAGERRWRAVQTLEWEEVPVIIRQMSDTETASVALIENLQREELTVIEEALAYSQLLELHELTQEALAQRLGKSQSTIANKLRLLKLPEDVHEALFNKQITERHARALIGLDEDVQLKVLKKVLAEQLNVKQTEELIQSYHAPKKKKRKKPRLKGVNKDVRIALNTIKQSLNMVSDTGIDVVADEEDLDDFYQITIKIPKK